ncbi:TPA: hypothetical protein QIY62_005040, partial [Serratia marcescens]|nr:hypothetical protein [Serratia marcescens]
RELPQGAGRGEKQRTAGLAALRSRAQKTPARAGAINHVPVTFPAVMLWRKRPSNTPTLRSLSATFSQQENRLESGIIIYAKICFSVANNN